MTHSVPLLVFSDLDGTLLDHESYSHAAAGPALSQLRRLGVPLVLASSKTAAEMAPLRAELGFDTCPAIVENGAGLLEANATPEPDAETYQRLRAALARVSPEMRERFCGFGDMTDTEVAEITGLAQDQAALARHRAFSEPGLWDGDITSEQAFVGALQAQGLQARRGGRFLTLSFGGTKADRMTEIIHRYQPGLTVALGDAPNDIEMLEAADIGVIVANPHGQPLPRLRTETPDTVTGPVRRTQKPGPDGWNDAVLRIASTLSSDQRQP